MGKSFFGVDLRVVLVALAGASFITVGAFFIPAPNFAEVVGKLGEALIVAALIAVLVDGPMARELNERMTSTNKVVRGANLYGVVDILMRRGHKNEDEFKAAVLDATKDQIDRGTGSICILCVAAPQLLRDDASFYDLLVKRFVSNGGNCELKVVLSCPTAKATLERAQLEKPHNPLGDISSTAGCLQSLSLNAADRVHFKCSEDASSVFMIMTDEKLFLEPYPIAKLERLSTVLGGRTPMLVFSRSSPSYDLWHKHFTHLWEKCPDYEVHHPHGEVEQSSAIRVVASKSA